MLGVTSASIAPANLAKSTSTEQQSGTTFVQQAVLALIQHGKYEKLSVLHSVLLLITLDTTNTTISQLF